MCMKVEGAAEKAKLTLSPSAREYAANKLAKMEVWLQQMEEAPPAEEHSLGKENTLRQDVVSPSLPRETLLACAACTVQGCLVVPKAFDEGA